MLLETIFDKLSIPVLERGKVMSHIKIRIFSVISFIIFSSYLYFTIGGYILSKHHDAVSNNIKSTEFFIKKSIDVLINEKKTFYIRKSDIIFTQDDILKKLEKKNRKEFYTLTKKYFDDIKKTDLNFWGLHLIFPDNMSFVRVHKPEAKDSLIKKGKKPLIDYVNENKKIITSFDSGKFGYFLRVITPVFSKDKKYLAAAEFSINVDSLSAHVKKMFGYEVQFLVKNVQNKHFLNILPKNKEDLVIFKSTNPDFFNIYNAGEEKELGENIIEFNKRFYKTTRIELSATADLETSFDVTDILKSHFIFEKQLQVLLSLTNIGFLFLWIFFTKYNIKKREKIDKKSKSLESQISSLENTINTNIAIIKTNTEGKIVYISDGFCKLSGFSKSEIEKLNQNIIKPDDMNIDEFYKVLEQVKKGEIFKREIIFKSNKQRKLFLDLTLIPEVDANNHFIGYTSILKDINSLKEYQNKIEKQKEDLDRLNQRFELTLNAVKDGIWDWNLLSNESYYSKEWKVMLGYKEDEIEATSSAFFNLIHDDDKTKIEEKLKKHIENPSLYNYEAELRLKCKDGTYKWILSRGECSFDNNKNPIRMLGSHTDINERKKNEEFIKKSNIILEMIASGEEASCVYNEIALMYESRHLGIRCSLLELHDGKLMHGGAPSMPKEYCEAINGLPYGPNVGSCGTSTYKKCRVIVENIETDPKWTNIKQYALPHGMRSCWSEPIFNSSGEVLGSFGMYYDYPALPNDEESEDLTSAARLAGIAMERDQSQKRILQDQKLISEQSKLAAMGEMIGNIAHQWRQPLSLISTVSTGRIFQQKMLGQVDGQLIKDMDMINETSQYLSRTIDDFRDFIKDDQEVKVSSIKEALEYTVKLTKASIENNFINLIVDIEDDLEILANKNELVQSFINIINNAKDILKENTEEENRYIFIKTKKLNDNYLELMICDSGGGIEDSIINRIFEPYFTTKHQSIGTGIGLSMVNKILRDKYKAKVSVLNDTSINDGKTYHGACFKILFKN